MTGPLPWIGAADMAQLLPMADAVDALEAALVGGLDPARQPPRSAVETAYGQLLLMPSEITGYAGVKVASVAPGNPGRGLDRVQAVYTLFDSRTLTPLAQLDGTALTSLRTPAVSAVAARHLAGSGASRLVVFGTGPQAWGHVAAIRAVRPITRVIVVGRDRSRTEAFVQRVSDAGLRASAGGPQAVGEADVVVCATTSGEPLFSADTVPRHACVIAIGAHEPDRHELDPELLGRAAVVVEDTATALREAGDILLAVAAGTLDPAALLSLSSIVTGRAGVDGARPRVFKGVGMAWQDLVVSAEIYRRLGR